MDIVNCFQFHVVPPLHYQVTPYYNGATKYVESLSVEAITDSEMEHTQYMANVGVDNL